MTDSHKVIQLYILYFTKTSVLPPAWWSDNHIRACTSKTHPFTESVNLTMSYSHKVERFSPHKIPSDGREPLEISPINQSTQCTCGQFTPLLTHFLHSVSQWACFITNIFQQRHYRGRQLVLSGQLCPFISLPATAVIKQNEETGSNNEAKKSFFRFIHFSLQFYSACFCLCCFLPLLLPLPLHAWVSLYIHF